MTTTDTDERTKDMTTDQKSEQGQEMRGRGRRFRDGEYVDPAAELARLRESNGELLECARMLALVTAEGEFKSDAERVEMHKIARAAIAKAEGNP
jgi:hypothetical protein